MKVYYYHITDCKKRGKVTDLRACSVKATKITRLCHFVLPRIYFQYFSNIIESEMQSLAIFIILLYIIAQSEAHWLDPHTMDKKHKNKLPGHSSEIAARESEETVLIKSACDSDIHLRRIVRLILSNAYLQNEMGYIKGHVNLMLSVTEHQFLLNYSQNKDTQENTAREISSTLEMAFQKPSQDKYYEMVLTTQEKIYLLIFNPTFGALATACVTLWILYKLVQAKFTWKSILKYFICFSYIIDFIVTYLLILRDKEIDNMVTIKTIGVAPPECNPKNMSWWTYINIQFQSTFFENPCKLYYQSTFDTYKYIIAPSKVFVRQFKTFMEPIGDLGEAFGKFGRGMFTSLPWGLNAILFPIMLISFFILTFIIFLFVTKPKFKLNLFHIFSIELGQNQPSALTSPSPPNHRAIDFRQNTTVRRRRNEHNAREVGGTKNHRVLVEDVSNSSPGSDVSNTRPDSDGDKLGEQFNNQEPEKNKNEKSVSDVSSDCTADSFSDSDGEEQQ